MAYEQKDGDGSLFKNDQKDTEMHPDYKGSITVGGRQYWLSAWLKSSKGGKKYMSLSAQEKKQQAGAPSRDVKPQTMADPDDDLPF